MADIAVILPAAGYGKRMESSQNKQFMMLSGKPVIVHTLEVFVQASEIQEIIVVTREDEVEYCQKIIAEYAIAKVKAVIAGGKERQHSVWNGLQHVSANCNIVVVHDGARPLLVPKILEAALHEVIEHHAVVVGVPVKDTIKVVDEDNIIISTPRRSSLWAVQTPQVFSKEILLQAYTKAWQEDILATDDAALVEAIGYNVKMVLGSYENIKITTSEDLVLAEAFLSRRGNK